MTPINHHEHDFEHEGRKLHISIKSYDEPVKETKLGGDECYTSIEISEHPHVNIPIKTMYAHNPIPEDIKDLVIQDIVRQIDSILKA